MKCLDNQPPDAPKVKRRAVSPYSEIITSDIFFEKVVTKNEEKDEKERIKFAKKKQRQKIKKRKEKANPSNWKREGTSHINKRPLKNLGELQSPIIESETEKEIETSSGHDDDSNFYEKEKLQPLPSTTDGPLKYLSKLWNCLSPPVPENHMINYWYVAVYYNEKTESKIRKRKGILDVLSEDS